MSTSTLFKEFKEKWNEQSKLDIVLNFRPLYMCHCDNVYVNENNAWQSRGHDSPLSADIMVVDKLRVPSLLCHANPL